VNKKAKVKGPINLYIRWPVLLAVFLAAVNVWIYRVDRTSGYIMTGIVILYAGMTVALYFYTWNTVSGELMRFAETYGFAQKNLLQEMSVPYALLLPYGKIVWMNEAFMDATNNLAKPGLTITHLFPEITRDLYPDEIDTDVELRVPRNGRDYRIELKRVDASGATGKNELTGKPITEEYFIAVYLYDETELNQYIRENKDERFIACLIYIDNYDEVMDNVEEVRQSLLIALVDRKVSQYIAGIDGIAKKMDHDKYFIVFKQKYFEKLKADRFSILEEVKAISVGNEIAPTLSIGLGMNANSYNKCYEYARIAIDLALGRGGDQAVIKEKEHITYYGGKTQQMTKNTRVKARVKAEALREFIMGKEQVIVMGHRMADVDSFGAAIGIYRIAKTLGKKIHIVIDEVTISVKPMIEMFQNNSEYEEDLFVSNEKILDMVDSNTMVIVVDTDKPSYTPCEQLLYVAKTVVVLDHHRQGAEVVRNAVLSYTEPYASSTCEMVAEIMQYIDDNIKIRSIEADCMYAGIMIDTNNFVTKTGVRTFEAAAFLRRNGADITRVRKMFRDDLDAYRAKAETIRRAEVYREYFAIARFPDVDIASPTIIGAQAANEMLNISGIKASFVLTRYRGKIYISARSIDEVNVQLVMERMGGGGHMSTAGAQVPHSDMDEAIATLKLTIDEMLEGGDI